MPAFLRNIDTVAFRVMDAVLGKGNSSRPRGPTARACLFRSRLHFFIALDVKAEVVEPDGLFLALV